MNGCSLISDFPLALPSDWRRDKLARLCTFVGSGGTPDSGNPDYYGGGIPWVQTGDLDDDWLSETSKTITDEGLRQSPTRLYPTTTLLMAMYGATIGKLGILKIPATVNQACCALVPRKVMDVRFIFYKLLSLRSELIAAGRGGGQQNISQETVKQKYLTYPILPEQQRIAAYLDASCAAIDAAVAAKRRQLETLDALRKSTIKRAVTMGLNPSVKTQRTDVEWIPEMPQHWRLVRIKDVMEFFNTVRVPLSAAERGVMTERTYDYYGASGVIDKVEAYLFDGTYILIAEDGANLLTRSKPLAFLATGKFWVNNHAHILKPRWGGDDTFFVTLLESQDFSLFVTGAAQPKLTMENLGRFKLAVPRVVEQKAIAAFIREKDAEFRPLFAQIERQIAIITAYRKSLIHECVTGQQRISETDVVRSQLSENTGQLNREPSEKIGRLKTNRADDRQCYADLGKALKGGGQFGSPLAIKFATEGGG